MTLLASDTPRLSNVLKFEEYADLGILRKAVTVYEATAQTYVPGAVLARTLVDGASTPAAVASNAGGATIGAITVYPSAKLGTYFVKALTSSATGAFQVFYPDGSLVGQGAVGTAFSGGGISFTITDAGTDIAVGDAYVIPVTGTEKYARVGEASELSDVVVFLTDKLGNAGSTAIAATTDVTVIVLAMGKAIVSKSALTYGATVTTDAEKACVHAALEAKKIFVSTTI